MKIQERLLILMDQFSEREKMARESAQYQVADAAAWLHDNSKVRAVPGMTDAHLGLLHTARAYGSSHHDRIPLIVKKRDLEGFVMAETSDLLQTGMHMSAVYEYTLKHIRDIILFRTTRDHLIAVTILLAKDPAQMQARIRARQKSLEQSPIKVAYDINTHDIIMTGADKVQQDKRQVFQLVSDAYVPQVPAGHTPLAVWVGVNAISL